MVSADAQWRSQKESFARRRLQGRQIFDALNSDDGVDTIRVHRKSLLHQVLTIARGYLGAVYIIQVNGRTYWVFTERVFHLVNSEVSY